MSWAAKFAGICAECDQRFEAGEQITRASAGDGYMHEKCPEQIDELQPGEKACAKCWLVHAGECA